MLAIGVLGKFIGGIFRFLLTPPILYLTLAVAAAGAGWWYHTTAVKAAYAKGASDTTTAWQTKLGKEKDRSDKALALQKSGQDLIVADLKAKLNTSEARKQRVIYTTKKVKEYVTTKADAQCVITDGFVRMHDSALAGTEQESDSILAGSGTTHVDAPTGLTLSAVAATTRDNYAECEARGDVILLWQDWYIANKALFAKTLLLQEPPIPLQSIAK
jgi:hypothetical protein